MVAAIYQLCERILPASVRGAAAVRRPDFKRVHLFRRKHCHRTRLFEFAEQVPVRKNSLLAKGREECGHERLLDFGTAELVTFFGESRQVELTRIAVATLTVNARAPVLARPRTASRQIKIRRSGPFVSVRAAAQKYHWLLRRWRSAGDDPASTKEVSRTFVATKHRPNCRQLHTLLII